MTNSRATERRHNFPLAHILLDALQGDPLARAALTCCVDERQRSYGIPPIDDLTSANS